MGDQTYDQHGFSVDGVGDLNGDGCSDLIVGAPYSDSAGTDAGKVTVYSGCDASVLYVYTGNAAGERFGFTVAGGEDVNGDRTPDFIVGAPNGFTSLGVTGYAKVYSGSDGSLLYKLDGAELDGLFGHAVDFASDLDGDGRPDPFVGGRGASKNGTSSGQIRGFSGIDGAPLWTVSGDQGGDVLGSVVATLGDLDGDGLDEVLGGAWLHSTATATKSGYARVYASHAKLAGVNCNFGPTGQ